MAKDASSLGEDVVTHFLHLLLVELKLVLLSKAVRLEMPLLSLPGADN